MPSAWQRQNNALAAQITLRWGVQEMTGRSTGRENRRQRRELSRQLAKEIFLRNAEPTSIGISRGDWILFCLAGAMGIALFISEKSAPMVVVSLCVMFGLLIHPFLHFPWILRTQSKRLRAIKSSLSLACALFLVLGLGFSEWPKPTARHLSVTDMSTIKAMVSSSSEHISISAVANDNEAYALAEQLSTAFWEAGWDVRPRRPRTLIAGGPIQMVTVQYADKDDVKHILIERAMRSVGLKVSSAYEPSVVNLEGSRLAIEVGKFENFMH